LNRRAVAVEQADDDDDYQYTGDDGGGAVAPQPDLPDGIESLAGAGRVRVYLDEDGKLQHVKSFDYAELAVDLEKIPRIFGWGDYVLEAMYPDGKYKGRFRITFAKSAWPRPSENGNGHGDSAAVTALMGELRAEREKSGQATDRVINTIAEMNKVTIAALTARHDAPAAPPADPLATIERVGSLIQSFIAPMLANRPDGAAPLDTLVNAFERGMNVAEGRGGNGDGNSGGGSLLSELRPLLGTVVNAIASASRPAATPSRQIAPPPRPAFQAAPPPNPSQTPAAPGAAPRLISPEVQAVKKNPIYAFAVGEILKLRDNFPTDYESAATAIERMAPPAYLDQMIKETETADVVEVLAVYDEAARSHAEWLREVWEIIKDDFAPEPEPEPRGAQASGDGEAAGIPPATAPAAAPAVPVDGGEAGTTIVVNGEAVE